MFRRYNLVILAALRDGIVLLDRGSWQAWQRRYQEALDQGLLIQEGPRGWSWTAEAERLAREST